MPFTKLLFNFLNQLPQPIAYILWEPQAQSFAKYIENSNTKVLKSGHPEAKEFFCKNYFIKANRFLKEKGFQPISWSLLLGKSSKKNQKGLWGWDSKRKKSFYIGHCSKE